MNTRQLYYLVTIAGTGNLSRAARALEISQPALSRFLLNCEQRFGVALFLRHRSQLMPTEVGRQVIDHAQRILDEQTRMLLTVRAFTGGRQTVIRLGTAPNRAAIIYSEIYNRFSRRYPDIALQLTELYASEQPAAVARGQLDLALGSGETSDLVTDVPIATEELLIALPVSHPLAGRASIRLPDLKDTPFALQGPRDNIRRIADGLLRQASFEPVVALETADVRLLDSMLRQGVGAGFVSRVHVSPCAEVVYRPLDPPQHQTLHIRYPKGHTLTEPERYLASLLMRQRLDDERYVAVHSPAADDLFAAAEETEDLRAAPTAAPAAHAGQRQPAAQPLNLDSQVLEYLIAIVEEKSLTAAADRFYLAQPSLSRHLRNVEQMVGTPLFTREHNRLIPTNAGKVFVNSARNMLHLEAEMYDFIRSYRSGHGGSLYLNCDPDIAPLLQEVVAEFGRRHPDIQLRVVEANRQTTQEALLGASCDLGLYLTCEPKHPLLHTRVLALSELVWYPDCSGAPVNAAPLTVGEPGRRMMLAPAGATLRAEQERLLAQHFPQPPQVVCEAQVPILQRLVAAGGADAILPLYLLDRSRYDQCRAFEPPQPFYLVLAWHSGRHLPPPAKELMDSIAQACAAALDLPPAARP